LTDHHNKEKQTLTRNHYSEAQTLTDHNYKEVKTLADHHNNKLRYNNTGRYDVLNKWFTFSGDNMNKNFGEINHFVRKYIHDLKQELKEKLVAVLFS
jgi:hypothetical protein